MHGYEKPLTSRDAVGRVRELESALNRSQAADATGGDRTSRIRRDAVQL
jgi:hypothetical protein